MGTENSNKNSKGVDPENCSKLKQNENNKEKPFIIPPTIITTQEDDFKQILVPSLKSTHEQMVRKFN